MSTIDTNVEDHNYQFVLVYASSGCPYKELVDDLKKMLQPGMKTIITGDFNFDKKENNVLSTFLKDRDFTQKVSWPTHIQGRTLDHCYASKTSKCN